MSELTLRRGAGSRGRGTVGRHLLVALFAVHGLVHVMGFAAALRLAEIAAVPSTPTIPTGIVPGSSVDVMLGTLWLLATLGFFAAAAGVALFVRGWRRLAAGSAVLSLLLCLAWWNAAPAGAVIDVAILSGLIVSALRRRRVGG